MQNKNTAFRPDIAGLRAIAVIAVVLYHFGVKGFSGGFVGVDIFFVISGFLMTGIIFSKIEINKFSFIDFYLARAKRIIPALAVLCLVLLVCGWFFLIPGDFRTLGKHAASSISFLSNFIFWREAGYFDASSHEKWLLHTWSLSVEWQFYIIYPLIIFTLKKILDTQSIKLSIATLAISSFGLSIYIGNNWPSAGFYLFPTRAWEMLAGGIVFLYPLRVSSKNARILEAMGLLILAYSIIQFSSSDVWPGWKAIIPIIGTILILYANRHRSVFTGTKISKSLGDASYSIYLWHWPVIVLISYLGLDQEMLPKALGITISIILGYTSLYLIEIPTRKINTFNYRLLPAIAYLSAMGMTAAAGAIIFLTSGVESRVIQSVAIASRESLNSNPRSAKCLTTTGVESPKCLFGSELAEIGAIVIGDSHADSTVTAVAAAIPEKATLFLGYRSCITIPDVKILGENASYNCGGFISNQLDKLSREYPGVPVFVINRTSVYINGHNEKKNTASGPLAYFDTPTKLDDAYKKEFKEKYISSICTLSANRPVFILNPIPEMGINIPRELAMKLMSDPSSEDIAIKESTYIARNEFAVSTIAQAAKKCNATILDPAKLLCSNGECKGSINGRPLYYDDNHLSEFGNKILTPLFEEPLRERG